MPRMTPDAWAALKADWKTGGYSNSELARRYGVTETAIRKRITKEGWTRDNEAAAERRADVLLLHQISKPEVPKAARAALRVITSAGGESSSSNQDGSSQEVRGVEPSTPDAAPSTTGGMARFFNISGPLAETVRKALSSDDGAIEAAAMVRAIVNQDALARGAEVAAVREAYLRLIRWLLAGTDDERAEAARILLAGRNDSVQGALQALVALDEHITKTQRRALNMDKPEKAGSVSSDQPAPSTQVNVSIAQLTTEQLEAFWRVNQRLDGVTAPDRLPLPPGLEPTKSGSPV